MHAKIVAGLAFTAALAFAQPVFATPDWKAVAQALGKSGTELPDGVYRVGLPRTDLKVTLDEIEIKPAFALGSWLAFQTAGDKDAMVMGDLVLTEDEINPVMKSLAGSGIEITGLHNHLLRAKPATMYMHIEGHGDAVKLADSLHAALEFSKTPLKSAAGASPAAVDLDTAAIDSIIGRNGKASGGVYQFTIPRAEKITEGDMPVPASMGTGIAINFEPLGGGRAAITGDFVLTADEVNPVIQQLREHSIEVTALHNHMLFDQPRLFFVHFWAHDDAKTLARGLRSALDKANLQRS
ncbi:DUF1259 domain-containing protein [Mesorhizobium captivum]|uniref:DUF1259 domain-containing protein n=1 Tax=Mesorhizobium captivum TaxID=3072319 RepID=UPI002A23F99C|nr:DUF1259 domain-containing protein [Mesorhizobium sp. VK23E]MDX8512148.1 DUF1259 domain-containing protein [Mesorhizobium sp. VK23E]